MKWITEPMRQLPVIGEYDLVVVGGSGTGVFAAVRAARLGLRVALIEGTGRLGGVAGNGLVNIWHSLYDIYDRRQIIAGLTGEMTERMVRHGDATVCKSESGAIRFNPAILACELDSLVAEHGITLMLHTKYAALSAADGRIEAIFVENKDGRGAVCASFFIDATGDGDLCRDAGLESYRHSTLQPPSACFLLQMPEDMRINRLMQEHGAEFGLDDDWGWGGGVPGLHDIRFCAYFHTYGVDCGTADGLTAAELDGRKKALALTRLLEKYASEEVRLVALSSMVGIRESAHYVTRFRAEQKPLLCGETYADTVMRGSYRIDIHHSDDGAITFKYLDGRRDVVYGRENRRETDSWLSEYGLREAPGDHYEVPFDILVQPSVTNLIPVGRMLHADEGAFGALRVMVNLNQLGEAAGVAAYLALDGGQPIQRVDGKQVRSLLIRGGSALD